MKVESPTGAIQVDSAIEARILSHAVAIGRGDPDDRPYFVHPGYKSETLDEVEFLDRETKAGKFIVRAVVANEAVEGLKQVADEKIEVKSFTSDTARLFLDVINRSRMEQEAGMELLDTSPSSHENVTPIEQAGRKRDGSTPPMPSAA